MSLKRPREPCTLRIALVSVSPSSCRSTQSKFHWPICQARKKSTKIKLLGPETARWGGGLPREGVVAENFVPALETLSSLGFEERNPGCPGNFAGMSRTPGGVQKVCAKKLRAHFSFPNLRPLQVADLAISWPLGPPPCAWRENHYAISPRAQRLKWRRPRFLPTF